MTMQDVAVKLTGDVKLTPAESVEVVRLLEGTTSKVSAAMSNVAEETIRARRKRIYRKLQTDGQVDLMCKAIFSLLEGQQ